MYVLGLIFQTTTPINDNEINKLLQFNAGLHNYEYISNSNIGKFHLWSDNVHLNRDGTICLANNFWVILNKSSHLGDNSWSYNRAVSNTHPKIVHSCHFNSIVLLSSLCLLISLGVLCNLLNVTINTDGTFVGYL